MMMLVTWVFEQQETYLILPDAEGNSSLAVPVSLQIVTNSNYII